MPIAVDEVQEIVRDASSQSSPLIPIGGGTQIDQGSLDNYVAILSTVGLSEIVEYSPRDLVVVAQAGMTLSALQEILAVNGQTLPLEVAAPEAQTLGGIVAAKSHNLTRASNGSVRDWLIGCHVVDGKGDVIVAGGKVVKNVAGYDLPKLYCGSWGTLGVITQVAFKLAPKPQTSRLLLMTLSAERNSEELLDEFAKTSPATFTFLLNTVAARHILGPDTPEAQFLALGFDGRADTVDALVSEAASIAAPFVFQTIDLPAPVAGRFRAGIRDLSIGSAPLRVRCSVLPSQVGAFARMLEWTAKRGGFESLVFADAGAGTVWAQIFPRADEAEDEEGAQELLDMRWMRLMPDFRDKCARVGGSTFMEAMPDVWRLAGYPKWLPEGPELEWSARIKAQLDPHSIFRGARNLGAR